MRGIAEPISPGQYFWMIIISVVAGGVYLWPQFLVQQDGPNSLEAMFTTTAIALLITAGYVSLALAVQQPTFAQHVGQLVPGAGIALVFGITGILCLGIDGLVLDLFGQMMRTFFYPRTPTALLDGTILAVVASLAGRSLVAVGRTMQFWAPIILGLLVLILAALMGYAQNWLAARPSGNWALYPWLHASAGTWYLYANRSVVATLTPHVRWRRPRDAYCWALGAITVQATALLALYVVIVGTLNLPAVAEMAFPLVYVVNLVTIHGFFLKGLGALAVIVWATSLVAYLTVHAFCFSWNVVSLFPRPSRFLRPITVGAVIMGWWAITRLYPVHLEQSRSLDALAQSVGPRLDDYRHAGSHPGSAQA